MFFLKNKENCENNSFCQDSSKLTDINKFKTVKLFSNVKAKNFGLLSSGVSKTIIKSNLTIVNSSVGDLKLDDPSILLALDLIGRGKNLLYYSALTPEEEIIGKLVLALSGLNELLLKRGALINDKSAMAMFEKACSKVYSSNLKVAKGSILNSLWVEVKKLKQDNNLDIVIIDYLEGFGIDYLDQKENFQDLLEHFNEMSLNIEIPIIIMSRT